MSFSRLGMFLLIAFITVGCTTVDPYTGETRVDEGATAAAVAGLAVLGAAAYAASNDDDDDRHENHRYHRDYDRNYDRNSDSYRNSYSPRSGVTCYRYKHACYKDGHYSSKWTRREFN